jgi:hypothetical protein
MTDVESALAVIAEESPDDEIKRLWGKSREYVQVTPTGLLWQTTEEMPIEVFGVLCGVFGEARKMLRWAIGDILLYGDRSQDYAQFENLLGLSSSTLDQYRRVAGHIPYEERDNTVPWTAYQITGHLDPEVRDDLIDQYMTNQIEDTTELREEVNALSGNQPACDLLPPCPKCAGKLNARKCKGCGLDFPAAIGWLHQLLKGKDE